MARRATALVVALILSSVAISALGQNFPAFSNFGRGIDIKRGIFDGIIGAPVISLTSNQGRMWYSPITRETYTLPDQLEVSSTPGVVLQSKGYDVKELSDYVVEQHKWSSFKIGIGFLGFGKSKEAGSVKAQLESGGSVMFVAERHFQLYDVASYPYELLDQPSRTRFQTSVNNLPSTCGSAADQEAYNRLMGLYGTHYFTQATYGGTMKYLVSTKADYVYRKSMSYVIKQVSFFIGILDYGLKFNSGSNTTEIRIDEEFLQMSKVTLVLNGGTHQLDGTNIRTWLQQVVQSPALIKANLRPLHELVADGAKAACLSQTITSYLQNTEQDLPSGRKRFAVAEKETVSAISAKAAFRWALSAKDNFGRKRSVLADLNLQNNGAAIPGATWIGMSIDGATMQTNVLPVIGLTSQVAAGGPACSHQAKCGGCWYNANVGLTYTIPDQMCFKPENQFVMSNGSQEITSTSDLKYFYEKITKKKGFLGLSSKSETYRRTITNSYKRNEALDYYYVLMSWYELGLSPFNRPVHPKFRESYQTLPASWSTDQNSWEFKQYERFIEYWGTHYVDSAVLGGSMKMETWFHKCFLRTSDSEFRQKQKKSSFIIASKKSGEQTSSESVDEKWQEYSRQTLDLQGGRAFEYDPTQWREWLPTVYENPTPLSWGLTKISDLLPSGPVRNNLASAIDDYLARSEAEARQLPLEMERNPPPVDRPPWCVA